MKASRILILCLFFFPLFGTAQNQSGPLNLSTFDNRTWHFGFMLGFNGMNLSTQTDLTQGDSIISLETKNGGGFNINILADYHIAPNWDIRFVPGLSFGERNIEYLMQWNAGNELVVKNIQSTYLEFPLLLKYRSFRDENFAAYLIGGFKYSLDLSSQWDVDNDVAPLNQLVILNRHNTWAELGVGSDLFLEYFKFSVELRLSLGLNDMILHDNSMWVQPINQGIPRMFLVGFCFEG